MISMRIGAQLYTVHDFTKTLDGLDESLKKVADIGYKFVQVSGTCAYDGDWLNERLKRYGLACVITHSDKDLFDNPGKLIEHHDKFGCKYVGLGSMPGLWDKDKSVDEVYEKFKEEYTPVIKELKKAGKYFMYHNHDMELIKLKNGNNILRQMADDFAPDEVGFTLDTYWLQYAGCDPIEYITDFKGRVPCIHLKDLAVERGSDAPRITKMAPIFEGNMNFNGILKACETAGCEYLLVEQDDCYGTDPFECLKISYDNLKSHGLD